jgi:hypothetical protein
MFIDFVFYYGAYIWNFEIGVKGVIRHVPRCVSNGSKYFGRKLLTAAPGVNRKQDLLQNKQAKSLRRRTFVRISQVDFEICLIAL